MQVGDLVRWENQAGEYELGIVTSMSLSLPGGVMVYFFDDAATSEMTKEDLKVIK